MVEPPLETTLASLLRYYRQQIDSVEEELIRNDFLQGVSEAIWDLNSEGSASSPPCTLENMSQDVKPAEAARTC